MRAMYASLKDKKVIPSAVLMPWPPEKERIVGVNYFGKVRVSTVFLGLDPSFRDTGPSQWFETMIFGGRFDHEQQRYETWKQAEYGHKRWCKIVKFHNRWFMRLWDWITRAQT